MANAVETFLEKANEQDTNKGEFSKEDLQVFTNLVETPEDFDSLLVGFKDEEIREEMGKIGVLEAVKNFVKDKKGLISVFDKEYKDLEVNADLASNQELYEVCMLGAILTDKPFAKSYYESLFEGIEAKVETKEEDIVGTYETAKSDMQKDTVTEIENTTTIEAGKEITEASITVSAGADLRTMNLEKAKTQRNENIAALKILEDKFTGDNLTAIENIINDLSVTNIESRIKDIGTGKNDNIEQLGNRYLIGARIAEGFIQALSIITTEAKLTLEIDWANCIIGKSTTKGDIQDDRFINMNLSLKVESAEVKPGETEEEKKIREEAELKAEAEKKAKEDAEAAAIKAAEEAKKVEVAKLVAEAKRTADILAKLKADKADKTEIEKAEKAAEAARLAAEKASGGKIDAPIEYKETAEIIHVKNDIANHFKFKEKDISEGDVTDIVDNKNNTFIVAIQGYTGFEIKYTGTKKETIEIIQGTVSKGLLKRNITNATVKIDRYKKDRIGIKQNVTPMFDAEKSKNYINTRIKTTGNQGKYEVKQANEVTESKIDLYYKNPTTLKQKDSKDIEDKISLTLDDTYYLIKQDTIGNIPTQRQKIEGKETEVQMQKSSGYYINDTKQQITYYSQTTGGSKNPEIKIINNIMKGEKTSTGVDNTPLFPEYNPILKNKETVEAYTEKVKLEYETPEITSIEKQFKKGAHLQNVAGNEYKILADFSVPNINKSIQLELPVTYDLGNIQTNNTPLITYKKDPKLSDTNDYNKIILPNKDIMIDGIIYDITTPERGAGKVPNIVFAHNTIKTLKQVDDWAKKYKITSNIFKETLINGIGSDEKGKGALDNVKGDMGNLSYGPLTIKDGKREDPVKYFKEVYVAEEKENNHVVLPGAKIATMYFDQYGKCLYHTIDDEYMTFGNQNTTADVKEQTPQGLNGILGNKDKNILITSTMEEEEIKINMMNPDKIYNDNKTGNSFIDEKDEEKGKNIDKYFYNDFDFHNQIAKGRVNIFKGLQKISGADDVMKGDSKDLFNLAPITEDKVNANVVLGGRKGIYAYKLINEHTETKAGKTYSYPAQYVYSKTGEDGKIQLCNTKGEELKTQIIYLKKSNDYYTLQIADNGTEFKIVGKKKEVEKQISEVNISVDKKLHSYIGDLENDRTCAYQAVMKEGKTAYEFTSGKYTSLAVDVVAEGGSTTLEGEDKIKNIDAFSLLDANKEGFGSYIDFFTTPERESLGIDEKTYQETYKKLLQDNVEASDKLVKVKYQKDGKFYYAPMYLEVSKKGNKNIFSLKTPEGRTKANQEIERRLENMVKARKVGLEQDSMDKIKGAEMRGWYLVKPNLESLKKYFKDPETNTTMSVFLRTNNKENGKYTEQEIKFDPKKETIDPKEIIIEEIIYSLTLKPYNEVGYKIIVKKKGVENAKEVTPAK